MGLRLHCHSQSGGSPSADMLTKLIFPVHVGLAGQDFVGTSLMPCAPAAEPSILFKLVFKSLRQCAGGYLDAAVSRWKEEKREQQNQRAFRSGDSPYVLENMYLNRF